MSHDTRSSETPLFLGLQNTKTEGSLPNGALVEATNVMIDGAGCIHRRPGFRQVAAGRVTASYSSKDNEVCYLVIDNKLVLFTGSELILLLEDVGNDIMWAEESAGLIFMKSSNWYVALSGIDVKNLYIPSVSSFSCSVGSGALPECEVRVAVQYECVASDIKGPFSSVTTLKIGGGSSILVNLESRGGFRSHVYAEFVGVTPFTFIGHSESFLVINSLPDRYVPLDDLFFETSSVPSQGSSMTFYKNRVCIATIDAMASYIQFSIPGAYHIFDSIREDFEVPDVVTAMAQVNGKLLITGVRSIWEYSDAGLSRISLYGTPPGNPIQLLPDGAALITTFRGICTYPDFKNSTDSVFSVPIGRRSTSSLVQVEGEDFLFFTSDDTGLAYNSSFII